MTKAGCGIRLRPLGNAAYVACLPLLCQGSKWLNGKSVWLVFGRSCVWIPAGSRIFFCGFISHSLNKHIVIHERLLLLTVNNIKPMYLYIWLIYILFVYFNVVLVTIPFLHCWNPLIIFQKISLGCLLFGILFRQKHSSSVRLYIGKRNLCVMFSFTSSEVGASFRASNEQETCDLYQELVTGRPSPSQGTSVHIKQLQEIWCGWNHSFSFTTYQHCIPYWNNTPKYVEYHVNCSQYGIVGHQSHHHLQN